MRYWVYLNNQVSGPVEKEKLAGLPGFGLSTLVSPETQAGGEAVGWKEASVYPELQAALEAGKAAAQPRRPAAESPIAMTMRGTLIEDVVPETPAPAPAPKPAAVSPIGMTMRGTLIDEPPPGLEPAFPPAPQKAPVPAVSAPPKEEAGAAAGPELRQKLEQMSAMLVSIGNTQSQLLERLGRLESAVGEMKALLFPPPPKY